MARRSHCLIAALLLTACADDETTVSTPPVAAACEPGEIELADGVCLPAGTIAGGCQAGQLALDDGSCLDAGTQPSGCAAGELTLDDGSCQPAGVPAASCGNGFVSAADGGCDPVLPTAPCSTATIALMGETSCRRLSSCGAAPWGDIPVDTTTQYVDQGYTGGGSDGSAGAPWTTIQQAVDAAASGAIVAVAAGSYDESVVISGKPVQLWGICAEQVDIANTTVDAPAIAVESADGGELHALAVSGAGRGIDVSASQGVTLDGVWVHDTAGYGINAFDEPPAATALTIRNVLVETATEQGIWIEGSDVVIEDSSVRDTTALANGTYGWGIAILEDEETFKHATGIVRRSLVERNLEVAVLVHAADVDIEEVVVRNTSASASGRFGRSIVAQSADPSTEPTNMTLRSTVISQGSDGGLVITASNVDAEALTIRDIAVRPDSGERGYGIAAQHDPATGTPSTVHVRGALIERASEMGLLFAAGGGSAKGVIVRDTRPIDDGTFGRGMGVQVEPNYAISPTVEIQGCLIESNHEVGIMVAGGTTLIEGTLIRDQLARPSDDTMGWGLGVQDDIPTGERATFTLRYSVLDNNTSLGAFLAGSDALLEASAVSSTQPQLASGLFGRGINIQDNIASQQVANVTVASCVVSDSSEHGVFTSGMNARIEASVVRATKPQAARNIAGRGIGLQFLAETGNRPQLELVGSLVESSHETGIFVAGGDLFAESSVVRTTLPDADGLYGDGIVVATLANTSTALLAGSRVEDNARAGLANFGGDVTLRSSRVVCNEIDLTGQQLFGAEPAFVDEGNNVCGCSSDACRVLSAELEPPQAYDGPNPDTQ